MDAKGKFFNAVGIVLILISGYSILNTAYYLAISNAVAGVVTGYKEGAGGGFPSRGVVYYPVVKFVCCNNRNIEFVGKPGSDPPRYARGENVRVLFDKSKPEGARIYSFSSTWIFPLAGLGLGMLLITGLYKNNTHNKPPGPAR